MHSLIRNMKKREGFTLIELMIVVAIIGILAAIAIPNFIKFQLRAKAGEGKVNLAAIRTSEESYFADAGTYTGWPAEPGVAPVQTKAAWFGPAATATPCTVPVPAVGDPGYCFIGWQPEGDVFYQYAVAVANTAGGASPNEFFADAQSDIDGDTTLNTWGIAVPDLAGTTTLMPGGGLLGCINVVNLTDPTSATFSLGQVGPCDSVENGRNIF